MSSRTKILIVCAGLLLVLAGTVIIHHYRVKGAVKRYKAELAAKGEPILWTEVALPPLDPKENSASLVLRMATRLPRSGRLSEEDVTGMEMVAPGKAMADWAQPWVGDLPASNSWAEVLADYEVQRALLAEFHSLIDKPHIEHNLDYSQGFSLLLPHLAPSKSSVRRLGAASVCELHLENTREALLHLRSMVAMSQGMSREPLLISQLVRIAITAIAAETTWDLLQSDGLVESQLATLQEDWSQLEFFCPLEKAFLMERCMSLQTIQLMRESPDEFNNVVSWIGPGAASGTAPTAPRNGFLGSIQWITEKGLDRTRAGLAEGAWHTSWSYKDELRMLKGNEALVEVVRLGITNGFAINAMKLAEAMKQDGRIPISVDDYSGRGSAWLGLQTLFSNGIERSDRSFTKTVRAQAIAKVVVAAIALERYRLKHGGYPSSLGELVPDYVERIPSDPIDGEALRYRRVSPETYLLYSIGENLKDDGGDPISQEAYTRETSLSWMRGKDWVWPQSAEEAEVQAYWENEIAENYFQMFIPESEIDPSTAVPYEARERKENIERVARQWTQQYFRTLTNTANNAGSF